MDTIKSRLRDYIKIEIFIFISNAKYISFEAVFDSIVWFFIIFYNKNPLYQTVTHTFQLLSSVSNFRVIIFA